MVEALDFKRDGNPLEGFELGHDIPFKGLCQLY